MSQTYAGAYPGGALGALAPGSLTGCQKKKKKERERKKGKKGKKERKTIGLNQHEIGCHSSTSRGALRGSREENFRGAKLTAGVGGGGY